MSKFFNSDLMGSIAGASSIAMGGLEQSGGVFAPSPTELKFKEAFSNSFFAQENISFKREPVVIPPRSAPEEENPFKGTHLQKPFENLMQLEEKGIIKKGEWALAGSASLWVISEAGKEDGRKPLINRLPNDLDIVVTGESAKRIAAMGNIKESAISGFQVELHTEHDAEQKLDFTTYWPTTAPVENAKDLAAVTMDVHGVQVMKPQAAFGLKSRFVRDKDHADLEHGHEAIATSWQAAPAEPKVDNVSTTAPSRPKVKARPGMAFA